MNRNDVRERDTFFSLGIIIDFGDLAPTVQGPRWPRYIAYI